MIAILYFLKKVNCFPEIHMQKYSLDHGESVLEKTNGKVLKHKYVIVCKLRMTLNHVRVQ